jgi:signal peptidase
MRALKHLGDAVLWVVAALGLLSLLVWGATQLGYIKPLVVISGSMEPKIMTGDLLVDVSHPTAQVQPGQVTSIYSDVTHNLVSHRIVDIQPAGDGQWAVTMKGDANHVQDGGTYLVGDRVWQPAVRIPHGGYVVTAVTRRSIALPLGFALFCLLSLSLLPSSSRSERRGRHSAVPVAAGAVPVDAGVRTAP